MTNGKSGRKKLAKKLTSTIIVLIIALVVSFLGIDVLGINPEQEFVLITTPTTETKLEPTYEVTTVPVQNTEGELVVHMIDVGQADSFLLIQDDTVVLIDCGEKGKDVLGYIKNLGITEVDYVVGTHPHYDHMGGMYEVITDEDIEVEKVILPQGTPGSTTSWFPKLMTELNNGEYQLHYAKENDVFNIGQATMQVLIAEEEDIAGEVNNYSICLKVSFGQMDIIFTGDAEEHIEQKILESGVDIDAEILKVGHHGSDSSTCEEFLDAISPDYALISAGVGNRYEHPIKSTMENLEERNIEVYRTDECGSVIVTVTTDDVTFNCEPGDYLSGVELEEREGK